MKRLYTGACDFSRRSFLQAGVNSAKIWGNDMMVHHNLWFFLQSKKAEETLDLSWSRTHTHRSLVVALLVEAPHQRQSRSMRKLGDTIGERTTDAMHVTRPCRNCEFPFCCILYNTTRVPTKVHPPSTDTEVEGAERNMFRTPALALFYDYFAAIPDTDWIFDLDREGPPLYNQNTSLLPLDLVTYAPPI